MDRRSTGREWAHGLTALILGLFLLGVSSGTGILKNIVDIWGNLLFIPEYPAVVLREAFTDWKERSWDNDKLNAEVSKLRAENERLRRELSRRTSEYYFAAASNDLRDLRDVRLSDDVIILADSQVSQDINKNLARVTLRAPMSWWNEIRIDKGERDGITTGLPIFHNGYLVGRVSTVSYMSSWAELITSQSFMIPAVIEETRELGVVVGDGNGTVLLEYIPAGRALAAGMKVSTAMLSEHLPPGLPIGVIAGQFRETSDGYVTYKIAPGADLSRFFSVSF